MFYYSELVKNNTFVVYIGGTRISFSKITGLGGGMERDIYVQGGDIGIPHVMVKPNTNMRTLTFERGFQTNNSTLAKLEPGTFIPEITIIILNDIGEAVYSYFVTDAWVTEWEDTELDALDGRLMISKIKVEYALIKKINMI